MGCLRCGKEIQGKDVFCAECKVHMEKDPVKPGTVAVIPVRTPKLSEKDKRKAKKSEGRKKNKNTGKKVGKKASPTEKENKQLRWMARILFVTAVLLLGAVCFLAYLLFNK